MKLGMIDGAIRHPPQEFSMARYVIANRLSGRSDEGRKRSQSALRTAFTAHFERSVQVLSAPAPAAEMDRQVMILEADEDEIAAKKASLPESVIVEVEKPRFPMMTRRSPLLTAFRESLLAAVAAAQPGTGAQLRVTVKGEGGTKIKGAEVVLFLRSGSKSLRIPGLDDPPIITNASGQFTFQFASKWTPIALVADPPGNFFGTIERISAPGSAVITLPKLPPANAKTGWWHDTLRASPFDLNAGKGIKVGVVDTGVGPHPALSHVNGVGAFLNGGAFLTASKARDVLMHGSHVCGTIGAQPTVNSQYGGIAPGVDLFCARVFEVEGGASQADTANAIDHLCSVVGVNLINMSLGGGASQVEQDAIRRARDLGTLCVCAAGNESGPISKSFPAAYPETVAVAAIGLNGFGPPGSIAASAAPTDSSLFGSEGLFFADFSNFGPKITCAGPGVGIISTVPERFGLTAPFAAMNGTSMASPAVCGKLAALLAADSKYLSSAADADRVDRAIKILQNNCRDVGLDDDHQGNGVPGKP